MITYKSPLIPNIDECDDDEGGDNNNNSNNNNNNEGDKSFKHIGKKEKRKSLAANHKTANTKNNLNNHNRFNDARDSENEEEEDNDDDYYDVEESASDIDGNVNANNECHHNKKTVARQKEHTAGKVACLKEAKEEFEKCKQQLQKLKQQRGRFSVPSGLLVDPEKRSVINSQQQQQTSKVNLLQSQTQEVMKDKCSGNKINICQQAKMLKQQINKKESMKVNKLRTSQNKKQSKDQFSSAHDIKFVELQLAPWQQQETIDQHQLQLKQHYTNIFSKNKSSNAYHPVKKSHVVKIAPMLKYFRTSSQSKQSKNALKNKNKQKILKTLKQPSTGVNNTQNNNEQNEEQQNNNNISQYNNKASQYHNNTSQYNSNTLQYNNNNIFCYQNDGGYNNIRYNNGGEYTQKNGKYRTNGGYKNGGYSFAATRNSSKSAISSFNYANLRRNYSGMNNGNNNNSNKNNNNNNKGNTKNGNRSKFGAKNNNNNNNKNNAKNSDGWRCSEANGVSEDGWYSDSSENGLLSGV